MAFMIEIVKTALRCLLSFIFATQTYVFSYFNFQIFHRSIFISPFQWTDWMSRRKSRFYNPNSKRQPASTLPKNNQPTSSVYRDSSYFKFLATKFISSEFSADNFIELLNASELAKSRKTWPFFSEENQ